MKQVFFTLILGSLTAFFYPPLSLSAQTTNIYVSPKGANTGTGSSTANPVSLTRARTLLKSTANKAKVCHVWLMDGIYTYLSLDSTDTRTVQAPVTYHALNVGKAVFQPITPIKPTDFQPIPDSIKNRIVDSVAKTKVRQVNLASYNLSNMAAWPKNFGYPASVSAAGSNHQRWPILYQNSTPLPMARYPNDSVMTMRTVLSNGTGGISPGGVFKYRDDRAKYWSKGIQEGLWLRGCWRVPWQMDFIKTDSITTKDSTVYQSIGVQGGIGDKYTRPAGNGKEPYIAVNLVEEIDTVGEWCINFATKMLYIYPPDTLSINISSNSATPTISLDRLNYTNFEGIKMDGGSSYGFFLNKCSNISLNGNEITHLSGYGIFMADPINCTVRSNDIHDVGEGGVFLASSTFSKDQSTLVPTNNKVVNNHIYNYAKEVYLYAAAIDTRYNIGCYVAFNNIHGCEHVGILYGGNNCDFEYNDISHVVQTYNDMGAFYSAENWKDRGSTILNNYIHNMDFKGSALYTDNGKPGEVLNNNIATNCLYGSQNNFGYYNTFNSNIYYNNFNGHHTNSTALLSDTVSTNTNNTGLKNLYNSSTIYQNAYPNLQSFYPKADTSYASPVWPQLTGSVFIGTSSYGDCIRSVADKSLFNTNGTTNNNYAKTGPPFKQYGLVCPSNLFLKTTTFKSGKTNLLDSIKSTGAFSKTLNTNWHISRLGLFKDSIYRTDISAFATEGKAPTFSVILKSKHAFIQKDTLSITVTVYNPNINNSYSFIKLYDSAKSLDSFPLTVKKSTFDSVVLTAQWNNPSVGKHYLLARLFDSTIWDFSSDTVAFSISIPLPIQLQNLYVDYQGCSPKAHWTTSVGGNGNMTIEQSNDGISFNSLLTQPFACLSANGCDFIEPLNNINAETRFIRLKTVSNEGGTLYSKTIALENPCKANDGIKAYPNPLMHGHDLTLVWGNGSASASRIEILDVWGNVVYKREYFGLQNNNTVTIKDLQLQTGNYFIKINNGDAGKKSIKLTVY